MAVAYGIESSETLVLTEHAIPLAPLAGESENLIHSTLLLICFVFGRQEEGNADAKARCASASEQLVDLFGTSGQHERITDRGTSVPLPESWYAASLLALPENAFGASASRKKTDKDDYEE